jgi:hypothetical protein
MELHRPKEDKLPYVCTITFNAAGGANGDIVQVCVSMFWVINLMDEGGWDEVLERTDLLEYYFKISSTTFYHEISINVGFNISNPFSLNKFPSPLLKLSLCKFPHLTTLIACSI